MTYAQLLARYKRRHKRLVEPRQGEDSLHPSLWLAYSIARRRSFTDLGTFAQKPGDHGYRPAYAFDLGRNNRFYNKGWNYLVARRLALFYWKHREALSINYVILGRKIISRQYPYWRPYTRDTSHDWHIHVSGIHE